MPRAQRHFCCLLAIDTSSSAGPKPFTKNLQSREKGYAPASHGDGGQPQMLPQPLCTLVTALNWVPLQALLGVVLLWMVWLAPSHGESRGAGWSDPTVLNGSINQPPSSLWGIWPRTQGGPGHTTAPSWPPRPRCLPRGQGDREEDKLPTRS